MTNHVAWPKHGTEWIAADIVKEMAKEDWEDDPENKGQQVRQLYLGSWVSNSASGKTYMPWACSNVSGCASCKGTGGHPLHRRKRVAKRRAARYDAVRRGYTRRGAWDNASARAWLTRQGKVSSRGKCGPSCTACGGLGSRQAYLDERWVAYTTSLLEGLGMSYEPEGDDLRAVQRRDSEEDEHG